MKYQIKAEIGTTVIFSSVLETNNISDAKRTLFNLVNSGTVSFDTQYGYMIFGKKQVENGTFTLIELSE
jgi:hypothetical protein